MSSPTGPPRLRFAPSPTGYFHIGNARSALYNWLFARQHDGVFVLRIEDTDRERSKDEWTRGILEALQWLGLSWDEGPILQSERSALYATAVDALLAGGHLYACDCTREAIDERTKGNAIPGYDGFCADRGLGSGPGRALRFRVPDSGTTFVRDVVRGDVEFDNATIEDFIVVKSNGDPLFVLANVVDDRDMAITHVIRGEEHLPTTPKAVLIWEALSDDVPLPVYAHLSLLVNEKRQKLSKRRDRVAIEDYRALGFLPEALVNYLALLGWSPGNDRELFTLSELVEAFDLSDVMKSPAFFDEKRLLHFNGVYIRALGDDEFVERSLPFLMADDVPWAKDQFSEEVFRRVAPLVKERVATLGEVTRYVEFLFADPLVIDEKDAVKAIERDEFAQTILRQSTAAFASCSWDAETIKEIALGIGADLERGLSKTQAPIRVATLGRSIGLPLFESLEVLGRERTIERLTAAIDSKD